MIKLTERMERIVGLVPETEVVADVGCDHGKVGAALLLRGRAEKVLFCDVSAPSLRKARNIAEEYGLTDRAEFFVRDGLGDLRCDAAVIAGMGGGEILSIIGNAKALPEFLVLQPMHDATLLREKLKERYRFTADFTFYGGDKYYEIMRLERGFDEFTVIEAEFGRDNVRNPSEDFMRYLRFRLGKADEVLSVKEVESVRGLKERIEALLSGQFR